MLSALLSRPAETPAANRPSRTLFFWLVGAFAFTLLPHIEQLPAWLSLTIVLAMAVRIVLEWRRWPLPSTTFTALVALCLLAGIYLQYATFLGRDAGVPFMVGLLAIKFFELRGPRDIALIVFSSMFVAMSSLLYSQAVELFTYCLMMMWILTGILLRTHMGDSADLLISFMLRRSAFIFLQAIPLALFLFFFFPRYNGKFQLSLNDTSIGLSDRVEPGSISRLADNDSPALRVHFLAGNVPPIDEMYWRGLVLWLYQRGAWTPGPTAGLREPHFNSTPGSYITQEITVWPNYQKWLFALDYPLTVPEPTESSDFTGPAPWAVRLHGNILQMGGTQSQMVDHKEQYEVTSASDLQEQTFTPADQKAALQLPSDEIDPRVASLANQLHQRDSEEQAYIRAVLYYFRHEGFTYSSNPGLPLPGSNALADFLFRSKSGFCEHYASAFAVLMRLQGIPTRMVVGYHGAEYNRYGDFYLVKQSNAHAWDEVWTGEKKRWMRVDPTAALSGGTGDSLASLSDPDSGDNSQGLSLQVAHHRLTLLSGKSMPGWLRYSLAELQLRRQQVEADWDDWVFSYNPQSQNRLAQALGFARHSHFIFMLASLTVAMTLGALFWWLMKAREVISPLDRLYVKFCRAMAQRGAPRSPWEGPLAYTGRLAQIFPEQRLSLAAVGRMISQTRYGPVSLQHSSPEDLQSLLRLIMDSRTPSSSLERS